MSTDIITVGAHPDSIVKRYTNPNKYKGLKIIHAGLHRSGSSSLSVALDILGFGPCYHSATYSQIYPERFRASCNWWFGNKILQKLNKNREDEVVFDEWLDIINCQVVMDFPINFHWDKIYKQYPDCKVILGIRDTFDKWYESNNYLVYQFSIKSWILHYIGPLVDPYWDAVIHHYFGAYYKEGIPFLLDPKNKERVKEIYYDGVMQKCKELVPEKNLLIYNIKDGWEPLCNFLGVDIPKDVPFPRINDKKDLDTIFETSKRIILVQFGKLLLKSFVAAAICAFIGYKSGLFERLFLFVFSCFVGMVVLMILSTR